MPRPLAYLGQAAVYGVIALGIGYFSARPLYERFPADRAEIVVSFSHTGERVTPCRKLSREEIAALAANMRRSEVCPRERRPLDLEVRLGDRPLYAARLQPTGISRDGASQVHARFAVPAGRQRLTARLRDSARKVGFDYEAEAMIDLRPLQRFVVDFRSELGGFRFGHEEASGPDERRAP